MKSEIEVNEQISRIRQMETIISRTQLASGLGLQFGGARDLYQAFGYKTELTFQDYFNQYDRQDIASAVIDTPIDATWNGEFGIIESEKGNETVLEKTWQELEDKFHLKQTFIRLDTLSTLGQYGVLLFGFSDVKNPEDNMRQVVKGNGLSLLFLKPLSEDSAKISTWDDNTSSPRYGLPESYDITIKAQAGNSLRSIRVHYSRVIHVSGKVFESEVYGQPYLKKVFNRLYDIEKLVGGGAEMWWRGARPGYEGTVDKEFTLTDTMKEDLINQLDEYENYLRRFLVVAGVKFNPMAQQIADPGTSVDVQINMISAATRIPKRILLGSERGELASSQDVQAFKEMIKARRENYCEPQIVRPTVDKLIEYGILTKSTTRYDVKWQDLFGMNAKDLADLGAVRAGTIKNLLSTPGAEVIVPESALYREFLGFDQDQIDLIEQEHEQALKEQEAELAKEEELRNQIEEEMQQQNINQPPIEEEV